MCGNIYEKEFNYPIRTHFDGPIRRSEVEDMVNKELEEVIAQSVPSLSCPAECGRKFIAITIVEKVFNIQDGRLVHLQSGSTQGGGGPHTLGSSYPAWYDVVGNLNYWVRVFCLRQGENVVVQDVGAPVTGSSVDPFSSRCGDNGSISTNYIGISSEVPISSVTQTSVVDTATSQAQAQALKNARGRANDALAQLSSRIACPAACFLLTYVYYEGAAVYKDRNWVKRDGSAVVQSRATLPFDATMYCMSWEAVLEVSAPG